MASFNRVGKKWRAQVFKKGVRKSKVFHTKAQAVTWANVVESSIDPLQAGSRTLGEAFRRFREEVTPHRKGARWEAIRLQKLEQDDIASLKMEDLQPHHFSTWRDRRLTEVKPGSVNRELSLMSGVLTYAVREWQWLTSNPVRMIKRAKAPKGRDRRISESEIDSILKHLKYDGGKPETKHQNLAVMFLLAIETGMRMGEILSIHPGGVFENHVTLGDTKNNDARDVPLSSKARELVKYCPLFFDDRPLDKRRNEASALFRKAVKACGIENLTFHDSRHEAVTRLAKKLDVLELARMIGHRDLKSLMIYYNESADVIAGKLG